jgi:hypothetical protein
MLVLLTAVAIGNVMAQESTNVVEPLDNQYLEMRAVTITNVEGQNKQVIFELWGNNIEFKRICSSFFI